MDPVARRTLTKAMIEEMKRRSDLVKYFDTQIKKPLGISSGTGSSRGGYRIEPYQKKRVRKAMEREGLAKGFNKTITGRITRKRG